MAEKEKGKEKEKEKKKEKEKEKKEKEKMIKTTSPGLRFERRLRGPEPRVLPLDDPGFF